jgi:hypothetical protein
MSNMSRRCSHVKTPANVKGEARQAMGVVT